MARKSRSVFREEESGAVAAVYALSLFALIGIAGVGYDYARMAGMHSELQNAADQAALAGASQLDEKTGACSRAAAAAAGLLTNETLLGKVESGSLAITITNESACDATGKIRFWQDAGKTTASNSDANANFVEVIVNERTADYALTPIIGLFNSGGLDAAAMAGLGSSVCKVPPIMICSPSPGVAFDAINRIGEGVVATGHSTGNSKTEGKPGDADTSTWAPGDFGFLQISESGDKTNRNSALLRALAYQNPPIDCTPVDDNRVSTGNPQGLYDAINTRFDIYDFPNNDNNGNVLGSCQGTNCPPASNVVKDFKNSDPSKNCKIVNGNGNNGGWKLPEEGFEFKPVAGAGPNYDDNGVIEVMGLPRDLCHYTSFNGTGKCNNGADGRFGDGNWARSDYFTKNHSGSFPTGWQTMTRYQTYLWELGKFGSGGSLPNVANQTASKACYSGAATPDASRRILTVAVVSNCASLTGASQPVVIDEWVDMFLVEPSVDAKVRYNNYKDAIYMEVIGPSSLAGDGTYASQQVRRDVPYLVR